MSLASFARRCASSMISSALPAPDNSDGGWRGGQPDCIVAADQQGPDASAGSRVAAATCPVPCGQSPPTKSRSRNFDFTIFDFSPFHFFNFPKFGKFETAQFVDRQKMKSADRRKHCLARSSTKLFRRKSEHDRNTFSADGRGARVGSALCRIFIPHYTAPQYPVGYPPDPVRYLTSLPWRDGKRGPHGNQPNGFCATGVGVVPQDGAEKARGRAGSPTRAPRHSVSYQLMLTGYPALP
jgi:hypothetical protein